MASYTYSIATDTANKQVALGKLTKEVRQSSITIALNTINLVGDNIYINFKASLPINDITTLTSIINNHDGILTTKPNIVTISEDKSGIEGLYQIKSVVLNVPANAELVKSVSLPYAIRLLDLEFKAKNNNDKAKAIIGENTLVGMIAQDTVVNDTVINVDDTTLNNVCCGYRIKLDNGVYSQTGIVIKKDIALKQLTIDNPLLSKYLKVNTYIYSSVMLTDDYIDLQANFEYRFGEKVIGGLLIPANTKLNIYYENSSSSPITIIFYMEYWY